MGIQSEDTAYRDITRYYNKDWNIEAYKIARKQIKDDEYNSLGIEGHSIYFLYGETEDGKLEVYVGRSSETMNNTPVFTRLYQHKTSTSERYREKWDNAIAIKFKDLEFDEMRNLENYFYHSLLDSVRLNNTEPDTKRYTYESIKNKVEYIKEFVNFILKEDVFKKDKKQEAVKEVPRLGYGEEELKQSGKRIVDKQSESVTEVQTPKNIVEQTLDLLPKNIWNPYTTFLDLSSTSGEFLKAVLNRLLASDLYKGTEYENTVARTLHIVSKQLYGVVLSDKSYELTTKNLMNKSNIIKIDEPYIQLNDIMKNFNIISSDNQPKTKILNAKEKLRILGIKENTFEEYLKNKFNIEDKNMKFNVIIGNPPYQQKTKSIYNEFIDSAIGLKPDAITMIVKNNWLVSDTLKSTRNNMINMGLTNIINYSEAGEIFNNIGAAVTIFGIQKGYRDKTHYTEIKKGKVIENYDENLRGARIIASNKIEQQIVNRFSKISKNEDFSIKTYPSEPFRITTNGRVGRGESAYDLETYNERSEKNNIAVIYMNEQKKPYVKYININDVPARAELAPKYKVICGRILTKDNNIINNIKLANPNTVCSSSWGVLFASDNLNETKAVEKYIKTKLFRFLVRCFSEDGVIAVSAYRFSLVPLQDFTSSSDIDWSQSIADIDKKLYKKYNLTDAEISYIEKTIKPMDTEPSKPTNTEPSKQKYTPQDLEANYINRQLQQQSK